MPSPISNYSLDFYIYEFCNIISKCIYCIHPNYITLFNYFITFIIFYIFYINYSLTVTFILCILRSFLDIMDGCHARQQNKCSKLGAYLDMLNDSLFMMGIPFIIGMNIKILLLKIIFYTVSFILFINCIYMLYSDNSDLLKNVPTKYKFLTILIHDNTILFIPVFITILQKITF